MCRLFGADVLFRCVGQTCGTCSVGRWDQLVLEFCRVKHP